MLAKKHIPTLKLNRHLTRVQEAKFMPFGRKKEKPKPEEKKPEEKKPEEKKK
jgi:hypothetical protein